MTDAQPKTVTEPQHEEPTRTGTVPTRRTVLVGAGAVGATAVLAACGTDAGTPAAPLPAGSANAPTGDAPTGDAPTGGGSTGTTLAAVKDVPNGGGVIKGDYVITQPSEGTFKAFSKVCTHQGCDVSQIANALIICKCHGSQFSIEDGSVKGGPAGKPLAATEVKVDGDNVVTA
jgi:Rieske Fe-S protein